MRRGRRRPGGFVENDRVTRWAVERLDDPREDEGFTVHDGADSAAVEDTAGHEAILADFAAAVRADREPAVPAASARLATELVLRIYEAAR